MGPKLHILRQPITDLGRYYAETHTIVLRSGLLLEKEREVLWHERRHALRGDTAGHNDLTVERVVDRQAAEDAMPWVSLEWAWNEATDLTEMAGLLKLPEPWVHKRLMTLHPAQKALLKISV